MLANDRRNILQQIVNDPGSTPLERTEATRALCESKSDQQLPPPRRHGRSANVPQSQADIDADLEQALTIRPNDGLTIMDRIEIERGLPEATRAILDAIGDNTLLWVFTNNLSDVPVLIDILGRTRSELVRSKSLDTLRVIAGHSSVQAAKQQAQEFLGQLNTQENQ